MAEKIPKSRNDGNQQTKNKSKKKKPKIFGVMTKRRWFGVLIFLSAMLWSYTAGPPLHKTITCNRYFMDGTTYDYRTVEFEGDMTLIDTIFKRGFWPNVFTWQIGAYFNWTKGPTWLNKYNKLIFSDTIQNKIFSWSTINGIQIELENAGDCTEDELNTLAEPGTNGILQNPKDDDILFIAQHARHRIISYNMMTKQSKVLIDKYNNKPLNSPNDLIMGPNMKYIYFTDPMHGLKEKNDKNMNNVHKKSKLGYSGIYRVNIENKKIELLDKTINSPNGLVFSSDNKKLFVSNCINGEFELHVFNVNKDGTIKLHQVWNEQTITSDTTYSFNAISGGAGCVNGISLVNTVNEQYLITTCPGGKLCILDENNGKMKSLIKLPDKTLLSNVAVGNDRNLYVTGNHTVWQIKLQPII